MNKEVYGMYCPEYDITFIVEDTYDEQKNTRIIKCKGMYHGEPNDYDNEMFNNDVTEIEYYC